MVLETTDTLTDNMHVTVQLQWLPQLLDALPDWLVEGMLGPGMAKFNELKRVSSVPVDLISTLEAPLMICSTASRKSRKP